MADLTRRWPVPYLYDVRDRLLIAWADPARGYHDLEHLNEVLDRLDELAAAGVAFPRIPVQLAAWFHDAVYDSAPEPEARSARWAREALAADSALATEVARLVLLTATHTPEPDDLAGAALCDADLAVLASRPARYAAYVAGVRAEYAHIDDVSFAAGRQAVLSALAQGPLFHTPHGLTHWEPRARLNLEAELAHLTP